MNPHDSEAEITRLKNGRTALAYKAEHAVDMDTGAIVAVYRQILQAATEDGAATASLSRRRSRVSASPWQRIAR